ncbi:MAG: hypothetical protein VKL42_12210 [Snowella sp.]|nr:hypothetical protein [Snowella sp.]
MLTKNIIFTILVFFEIPIFILAIKIFIYSIPEIIQPTGKYGGINIINVFTFNISLVIVLIIYAMIMRVLIFKQWVPIHKTWIAFYGLIFMIVFAVVLIILAMIRFYSLLKSG